MDPNHLIHIICRAVWIDYIHHGRRCDKRKKITRLCAEADSEPLILPSVEQYQSPHQIRQNGENNKIIFHITDFLNGEAKSCIGWIYRSVLLSLTRNWFIFQNVIIVSLPTNKHQPTPPPHMDGLIEVMFNIRCDFLQKTKLLLHIWTVCLRGY